MQQTQICKKIGLGSADMKKSVLEANLLCWGSFEFTKLGITNKWAVDVGLETFRCWKAKQGHAISNCFHCSHCWPRTLPQFSAGSCMCATNSIITGCELTWIPIHCADRSITDGLLGSHADWVNTNCQTNTSRVQRWFESITESCVLSVTSSRSDPEVLLQELIEVMYPKWPDYFHRYFSSLGQNGWNCNEESSSPFHPRKRILSLRPIQPILGAQTVMWADLLISSKQDYTWVCLANNQNSFSYASSIASALFSITPPGLRTSRNQETQASGHFKFSPKFPAIHQGSEGLMSGTNPSLVILIPLPHKPLQTYKKDNRLWLTGQQLGTCQVSWPAPKSLNQSLDWRSPIPWTSTSIVCYLKGPVDECQNLWINWENESAENKWTELQIAATAKSPW